MSWNNINKDFIQEMDKRRKTPRMFTDGVMRTSRYGANAAYFMDHVKRNYHAPKEKEPWLNDIRFTQ